jgi:hypothetical protein
VLQGGACALPFVRCSDKIGDRETFRHCPATRPNRKRIIAALFVVLACLHAARAEAQGTAAPGRAWWPNSVCYHMFVRSFFDSGGDGIGDLNGLVQKLASINDGNAQTRQDLISGEQPSRARSFDR